MSTIAYNLPIYDRTKHKGAESMATPSTDNQLRPELVKIVEDIVGLRQLSATTGFSTFRTQREIINRLSPEDMAAVGHALAKLAQQKK
jgi:hypothetical protein